MKTYEPQCGETIGETAKCMVAMAIGAQQSVQAKFNDILLTANPGDTQDSIVDFYNDELNHRREAYINSPEYAAQQREIEAARRREAIAFDEAMKAAPEKMSLCDEAGWAQAVEANRDGYGSGVIRYAEQWARIMEGRIARGETVQSCAEAASHTADNEGITGFMYGCAVSILSQVWLHGEELRRWHNKSSQIGDEGDRANESGGVLNPALISIGSN